MRRLDADAREPECLRRGRDDRHRAIGRNREDPVTPWRRPASITASTSVKSTTTLRSGEPRRFGIAVDADDTKAQFPCPLDRAPLVSSGPDHLDRSFHRGDSIRGVGSEPCL
jgi:hypothetical protein